MNRGMATMEDPNKRARAGVSKVLHVRALPDYANEVELAALVKPFGGLHKCLVIADKHQAFLQMDSEESATKVLAHYDMTPAMIRDKQIYLQYSSRQTVETKQQGMGGYGMQQQAPGTVLLVTVMNVAVPVTLENIHQIFQPHGSVMKIITFSKGGNFQALVQMASLEQAQNAKMYLEGKDMFQGCCHLRIDFSKRQQLAVKENTYKSRDYTSGAPLQSPTPPMFGGPGYGGAGMMPGMPMPGMGGMGMAGMARQGGCVVLVNKLVPDQVTPHTLFQLFGVYGDVLRVKILYNNRDTAMVQFVNSQQAQNAIANLNGCILHGQEIVVTSSKHSDVKVPRTEDAKDGAALTQDFTSSPAHRFKNKTFMNQKNVNAPSQVLHLANIHESVTEDSLAEMFAQYQAPGSQMPVVEFFKSSRKMAYVCMASVPEAVAALVQAHNQVIGGYPVRVSFSHKKPEAILQSIAGVQPMAGVPMQQPMATM